MDLKNEERQTFLRRILGLNYEHNKETQTGGLGMEFALLLFTKERRERIALVSDSLVIQANPSQKTRDSLKKFVFVRATGAILSGCP